MYCCTYRKRKTLHQQLAFDTIARCSKRLPNASLRSFSLQNLLTRALSASGRRARSMSHCQAPMRRVDPSTSKNQRRTRQHVERGQLSVARYGTKRYGTKRKVQNGTVQNGGYKTVRWDTVHRLSYVKLNARTVPTVNSDYTEHSR